MATVTTTDPPRRVLRAAAAGSLTTSARALRWTVTAQAGARVEGAVVAAGGGSLLRTAVPLAAGALGPVLAGVAPADMPVFGEVPVFDVVPVPGFAPPFVPPAPDGGCVPVGRMPTLPWAVGTTSVPYPAPRP